MKLEKLTFVTESGKSIELSADEARSLFAELSNLFSDPFVITTPVPSVIPQYLTPATTWPAWIKWPEITCGSRTDSTIILD